MTLEERKQQRIEAENAEKDLLASNGSYQDFVLDLEEDETICTKINQIVARINQIAAITTNDGTKYNVNCFSLPSYIFGDVMAKVLGIVNVSGAMFTDERAKEFTAITNTSKLLWDKVADAFGSPAYFSKGIYNAGTPADMDKLAIAMKALLVNLNIPLRYADDINGDNVEIYFLKQEQKASAAEAEFTKSKLLDSTESFTLED